MWDVLIRSRSRQGSPMKEDDGTLMAGVARATEIYSCTSNPGCERRQAQHAILGGLNPMDANIPRSCSVYNRIHIHHRTHGGLRIHVRRMLRGENRCREHS